MHTGGRTGMAERKKPQSEMKYKGGESKAYWNLPDPCISSSFLLHVTALDMLDIQEQLFQAACFRKPKANSALTRSVAALPFN